MYTGNHLTTFKCWLTISIQAIKTVWQIYSLLQREQARQLGFSTHRSHSHQIVSFTGGYAPKGIFVEGSGSRLLEGMAVIGMYFPFQNSEEVEY
jgi:hypothetical protein